MKQFARRKWMQPALTIFFLCCLVQNGFSQGYHHSKTFKIASSGGWDYIAVGPSHLLYVSHGTQVNILNERNGDSVGVIPNTTGVHGIAFDPSTGQGFTSNGRLNTVTVFDLKTFKVLKQVPVGENPDAIMYDAFSKRIITCNGRSKDLSFLNPASGEVTGTVAVSGKPETAVSDENGKLFVNIEDKNLVEMINLKTMKVEGSWPISPGESPTGLAIDVKTKRLFAGCDKMLMVIDAENGKVVQKVPIADGCDGVAFDPATRNIFASCGEGKLTIIHESSSDNFSVVANVPTMRSARTCTIDLETHEIFLPAAEMEAAVSGQRPKMKDGTFQVLVMSDK